MTQLQTDVITLLIVLHTVYGILMWMRYNFRKNIEKGQTVGVRFGDYVVNREVALVLKGEISVLDFEENRLVSVPLNRVYMKSNEGEV